MIREIVRPDDYIGQEIEYIIFPINQSPKKNKKSKVILTLIKLSSTF